MRNQKQNNQVPFLIVGAGPAGLLTGIELLKLGLNTHIIERHKQQIRPLCGEYLGPQGVSYLKSLGLSEVLHDFDQVKGMTLYSTLETKITTNFPQGAYGVAVERKSFQESLARIFEKLGGVIHYDNSLEEIKATPEGYEILTNHQTFSAEYLIGADGRQSKVAKLLHFRTGGPIHNRLALHCYVTPRKPLPQFGQMHILPDGSYIGINPINASEVNFSIVTTPEAIKSAGGTRELINFWIKERSTLNQQFHLLKGEEIKSTAKITRDSIDICKQRAVLIGDAAGFIDPLTGEGMTTAIKTASILTQEIARSQVIEEAFKKYEIRRKNDFREKEKLNHFFQKLIHSPIGCELVGRVLNLSKQLRDTFIGIIGNVYTPTEGLKTIFKIYLQGRY